jgi:hypothetical protein
VSSPSQQTWQAWWFTHIIPATQEAIGRRMVVWGWPQEN